MEILLAKKLSDMSVSELEELLMKMRRQEPELYNILKELIEDS